MAKVILYRAWTHRKKISSSRIHKPSIAFSLLFQIASLYDKLLNKSVTLALYCEYNDKSRNRRGRLCHHLHCKAALQSSRYIKQHGVDVKHSAPPTKWSWYHLNVRAPTVITITLISSSIPVLGLSKRVQACWHTGMSCILWSTSCVVLTGLCEIMLDFICDFTALCQVSFWTGGYQRRWRRQIRSQQRSQGPHLEQKCVLCTYQNFLISTATLSIHIPSITVISQ